MSAEHPFSYRSDSRTFWSQWLQPYVMFMNDPS